MKVEKSKKSSKGITLIALVITIIVLLILAAVSIATLTGDNGILTRAQDSKTQTGIAEEKEAINLAYSGALAEKRGTGDVTADDLNREFGTNGTNATATDGANGTITVTFDPPSNRVYTIDSNGNITGPKTSENPGEDETTIVDGVTLPKKFTHITGDTKEEGIVVADSQGNQYVWVPVTKNEDGTPTTPYVSTNGKIREGSDIEIQIGRYSFDSTGEPSPTKGKYTEDTESNHNEEYGNMIAKDINRFKESVKENGGYFIARFEAGVTADTNFDISDMGENNTVLGPNNDWTAYDGDSSDIIIKQGEKVWNYITQNKAATLCRNLATTNGYEGLESDLMNSYSWDTAIVYIQECGNDSNYSNQKGVSTTQSSLSKTGEAILSQGNGKGMLDVQCNIFDMAGNCWEWTTETSDNPAFPCVLSGGVYGDSRFDTSYSYTERTNRSAKSDTFRPILYFV